MSNREKPERKMRVRIERRFALLALYQFDSGLANELDSVREALESAAEIDDSGELPDASTAADESPRAIQNLRRAAHAPSNKDSVSPR